MSAWPLIWTFEQDLLNNFVLKSCLFGATNIVKNRDKSKYVYIGYGIAFDGADFGNDFASNVVIFGVDNSSLSRTDNHEIFF